MKPAALTIFLLLARKPKPSGYPCLRCGKHNPAHLTWYDARMAVFPLCEKCWSSLSVNEREFYYVDHCVRVGQHPSIRTAILDAVRRGE